MKSCYFSLSMCFLPKKKSKICEHRTEYSNSHGFQLHWHRPFIQGTKVHINIIQAIVVTLGRRCRGRRGGLIDVAFITSQEIVY